MVTRLCVLGMPLTRSPAQSACRMVLRLPLLWTSAYTDVRVLLRALPAGFHLTTIGRLGPSPVERVERHLPQQPSSGDLVPAQMC